MAAYELRIDRPRRGAIDGEFISWFDAQLDAAAGAPLLITGTAEAFCAGVDLKFLLGLEGRQLEAFLRRVEALFRRLYEYPGPVVGLCEGHAVAGGAVILACCDQRLCADRPDIRIGLTEVALGLIPAMGGTARLARHLPTAIAMELLLTAKPVVSETLAHAGLINRLVEPADVLSVASGLAATLAANAPLALRAAREVIKASADLSEDEALSLEAQRSEMLARTEDAREGPLAFMEKRPPVFRGR